MYRDDDVAFVHMHVLLAVQVRLPRARQDVAKRPDYPLLLRLFGFFLDVIHLAQELDRGERLVRGYRIVNVVGEPGLPGLQERDLFHLVVPGIPAFAALAIVTGKHDAQQIARAADAEMRPDTIDDEMSDWRASDDQRVVI